MPHKDKERESGREDEKEDKCLLDVEHVQTSGEMCCHLSWRTPLNCSLCMFIGIKHISPTFRYIKPMYLRLKNIYKNPPQKYHVTYLLLFVRSWAPLITLLIAGALTDIQQPATASNVCTTDARLGGVGRVPPSPNKKILATPMTVKREREIERERERESVIEREIEIERDR